MKVEWSGSECVCVFACECVCACVRESLCMGEYHTKDNNRQHGDKNK